MKGDEEDFGVPFFEEDINHLNKNHRTPEIKGAYIFIFESINTDFKNSIEETIFFNQEADTCGKLRYA